jgi:hypothetical protein
MVANNGAALNKAAEVRKALARYPDKGPAEIARMLSKQHGVPFRGKAVSSIRTKLGQRPAPARAPAMPTAAQKTSAQRPGANSSARHAVKASVAAMVANLQTYIQRHGKGDLHRLIDTL